MKVLSEPEMEEHAADRMRELQVTTIDSLRDRVGSLSGGQRQAVAVARATLWDAKLLILDEPTAALGVSQTGQVLDLIRRLRAQGLGIVVITHNIDVVFEVADRIVVLYMGRRTATFDQRRRRRARSCRRSSAWRRRDPPPGLGGDRSRPVLGAAGDAGPVLPLLPPAHDVGAHDPERMAADIEAFVIALDEDLISADDFAR